VIEETEEMTIEGVEETGEMIEEAGEIGEMIEDLVVGIEEITGDSKCYFLMEIHNV
jgi:hypothetical protein